MKSALRKKVYETVLEEPKWKKAGFGSFKRNWNKDENILEQIPAENVRFLKFRRPEKRQVYFLGESYGTSGWKRAWLRQNRRLNWTLSVY